MKIEIADAPVLATGSVVVQHGQSIKTWPMGATGNYFVELRFNDAAEDPGIIRYAESTGYVVELKKLDSEFPTSNTTPLHVANHLGRKVMLNLSVQVVGRTPITRLIAYTFFDGGTAA